MEKLTYLSSLEDVMSCSDEVLSRDFGNLSPDTVASYVFFLRSELRNTKHQLEKCSEEINLLKFRQNSVGQYMTSFISVRKNI